VEDSVDALFAALSVQGAGVQALRAAYLDCLAAGGAEAGDLDVSHDRCRRVLLTGLTGPERLPRAEARALELALETLEAEISARI